MKKVKVLLFGVLLISSSHLMNAKSFPGKNPGNFTISLNNIEVRIAPDSSNELIWKISLDNLLKEKIAIRLINPNGEEVYTKDINIKHYKGNFIFPKEIKGRYLFEIKASGYVTTKEVYIH